jgi:SAM-dependent methyltransferase
MNQNQEHYSYAEYAKRDVAEGFDQLRFGGPIGSYMRELQEDQLKRWIHDPQNRTILDIGAGTGRTALPLAKMGAEVVAADASDEMLRVARKRAEEDKIDLKFSVCDVMDLPFDDRMFDTVMIFRVLMHVTDWKKAVAEICRCSENQIIFDFPPRYALAAMLVPYRSLKAKWDETVQNFRVFSLGQMKKEFKKHGFTFEAVEKQWFLPIALHKKIGSLGFTRGIEKFFAVTGMRSLWGAPVTVRARRMKQ